jgi:hypothetical protein
MAQAMIAICGVLCCCSSLAAALYAVPLPAADSTAPPDGFKQLVSGRTIYDKSPPQTEDVTLCSKDCSLDFTCKGFTTWDTKDAFGFIRTSCIKQTTVTDPWNTIPAWILNRNNSKVFIKNS